MSGVLDRINQRYGNDAVYFGAMQGAVAHDAAPMRIPLSNIPNAALDEDVVTRGRGHAPAPAPVAGDDDELWQQHLRRFKVLAEATHRETDRGKRNASDTAEAPGAGAGGWAAGRKRSVASSERTLF